MKLRNLETILREEPVYRLKQAREAVFQRLVSSWDEVMELPRELRDILKRECPLEIPARVFESKDGKTEKAALDLTDGNVAEAILMRHAGNRATVCVSSQAGCALRCDFCATGRSGFRRNFSASEIADQVIVFARRLKGEGQRVSNVVFMGMGEPFLNYREVMGAVRMMNSPDGLNIGARKISISTVGIVEGIEKLSREPWQVNLAISLHAPEDRLRSRLMPVNKKYPIEKVLNAVARYINKTRRRVMIEYLLLKDVNDSPEHARQLAALLKARLERLFFVNLISYNPTEKYLPSPPERVRKFKSALFRERINVIERYRFGKDIKAACGQLAGARRELMDDGRETKDADI